MQLGDRQRPPAALQRSTHLLAPMAPPDRTPLLPVIRAREDGALALVRRKHHRRMRLDVRVGVACRDAAVLLHGGVYLDIKGKPLRSLDETFRDEQHTLQVWDHAIGPNGLVSWGFAAPAGHPRLVDVLAAIRNNLLADQSRFVGLVGKRASVQLVGPAMLSRTLRWDPKTRRCRADGVRSRSGVAMSALIEYDGTKGTGCYYGNGSASRRVRYEV